MCGAVYGAFYLLAATAAWSQIVGPAFEVATIKPSAAPIDGRRAGQLTRNPGRVSYDYVSLENLLAQPYRIKNFQISGPEWLRSDRFDIVAKMAVDASDDQLALMLQKLLADRFHLVFHKERRSMGAYALMAAKGGPKIKALNDAQASGILTTSGPGGSRLSGKMGITLLAGLLSNMVDRPVVDMTEIKGIYDVDLEWSDRADGPPSLFTALQEKLGLALDNRKTPVDVYVVDHVERVPSEN